MLDHGTRVDACVILRIEAGGEVLAAADVRFAGSRAYTKRLLEPFLQTTDLETLRRLFPGVGSPGSREG